MTYLDQLKELLNRFTQSEVADLLNVTERSVQNYIAENQSTNPHVKTQRKITETYTKLIEEGISIEDYLNTSKPEVVNQTMERRRKDKEGQPGGLLEAFEGVPIYDVPIDASFLERYRDEATFHPLYFLNIPKLRNCNFGAIISGSSMYPIMKSGSIAMCRIVEDLNYIDPGEMYLISTKNGFETVKYVQVGDKNDELTLIPHNEKIKPTSIKKKMIIRMCIVEAWINFR